MGVEWMFEVEADASEEHGYLIHLGLKGAETAGRLTDLIVPCRSLQEFQEEIDKLLLKLKDLPRQVGQRLESLYLKDEAESKIAPEELWKRMETFDTEAEMAQFFNSFAERQRQEIAEYIFTHVNMFKGRGPVFSEHYDSTTHLLE
ncbi:MAG: hypothetical protein RBS57_09915 [Desulforhabdus sp.]|jgi:hypothetical protein|nr:hypothetical protein [Desulforhabdus sp.]